MFVGDYLGISIGYSELQYLTIIHLTKRTIMVLPLLQATSISGLNVLINSIYLGTWLFEWLRECRVPVQACEYMLRGVFAMHLTSSSPVSPV